MTNKNESIEIIMERSEKNVSIVKYGFDIALFLTKS